MKSWDRLQTLLTKWSTATQWRWYQHIWQQNPAGEDYRREKASLIEIGDLLTDVCPEALALYALPPAPIQHTEAAFETMARQMRQAAIVVAVARQRADAECDGGGRTRELTVAQAARRLGLSRGAVLTLIRNGSLAASDVSAGKRRKPRWRIAREDLDLFLANRRTTVPTKAGRGRRRENEGVTEYF